MQKLDEIKRLAQNGDFVKAQELYRSFMNEMFIWDEKDQLFRRKDAPQQITLSKDQYDDFINHHFKEWCGSQKRSMMKESQQSSIVVLNEGKSIDVKDGPLMASKTNKSSSKVSRSKNNEEDEHFLSDNEMIEEEDEHESIVSKVEKQKFSSDRRSRSQRNDLSKARDDVPTIKSQSKPVPEMKESLSQKRVESGSVSQVKQSATKQSATSSVKQSEPLVHQSATKQSATKQSATRQSAIKQTDPIVAQSASKQSAIKKNELNDIVSEENQSVIDQSVTRQSSVKQSATKHSNVRQTESVPPQSASKQSATKQSAVKETETIVPQSATKQSAIKETETTEKTETTLSEGASFEAASYVKKVFDEEVKTVPASSQRMNKSQRPDKSVLISYQSLVYEPLEVTRTDFEEYKKTYPDLLFFDPITGYPFIILRNKKCNSVCRVFATGDALTTQQNKFGLKNLYESRYLLRNYYRDISTVKTLSSTLSISAKKLE